MQRTHDTVQTAASTTHDADAQGAGRRQFFRVGGLFAAGLAASSVLAPATSWAGTMSSSTSDDVAILNTALGLEYQAIAAYQVGAESG
ncbi:MAG: DUF4439 domain-containing protein, partial [Thiomonas sp.]